MHVYTWLTTNWFSMHGTSTSILVSFKNNIESPLLKIYHSPKICSQTLSISNSFQLRKQEVYFLTPGCIRKPNNKNKSSLRDISTDVHVMYYFQIYTHSDSAHVWGRVLEYSMSPLSFSWTPDITPCSLSRKILCLKIMPKTLRCSWNYLTTHCDGRIIT